MLPQQRFSCVGRNRAIDTGERCQRIYPRQTFAGVINVSHSDCLLSIEAVRPGRLLPGKRF